jgi:hypothetical protein
MGREVVSEEKPFRVARFIEKFRRLARIERLKMRLPIVSGVELVELHIFLQVTRCEII